MSPSARSPERLLALARGAKAIASPETAAGRKARALLAPQTGLSAEGVEFALSECLEFRAPRSALTQLLRRAPQTSAAHVVLSANVFTAAYRAIALALAQTDEVTVRPSRRDPTMATLLCEASGGVFQITDDLSAEPGDHVWIYGTDETVAELRESLPAGVCLHAHGSGLGVAVAREPVTWNASLLKHAADALAQDVIAFDQRGCLSPRLLLLEGSDAFVEQFLKATCAALADWEATVPRGELTADEAADAFRYTQTMTYVGGCHMAGAGAVALDPQADRLLIPPTGRYLHVTRTEDPLGRLLELGSKLTTVGFFNAEQLIGQCVEHLGPRRYVDFGQMQRPPLDGPVDLRTGWSFDVL